MLLIIGFNYRLFSKNFSDFEEICCYIQRLTILSKYNLKKGSNSENSKSITFVCSCISRKISNPCNPLFEEKIKKSKSGLKNSKTDDKGSKLEKKVKRSNVDACLFRIRFKYQKSSSSIGFVKESYAWHNHPPNKNQTVQVS